MRGERAEDAAASREGGERGGADAVVVVRVAAAAEEAEEEVVGEDRERAETLEARAEAAAATAGETRKRLPSGSTPWGCARIGARGAREARCPEG